MNDALEARRAAVQAELAEHPEWPQRTVTVEDGKLGLPHGVGDPKEYMDWLNELGWRYDGAVRWVYVQEPGAPSLAELAAVQQQVKRDLRELNPRVGLSMGARPQNGRVELHYARTSDPAFLAFVAREKAKYGDLFHAEPTDHPPRLLAPKIMLVDPPGKPPAE